MRHYHGRCFCAPKKTRARKLWARDPWRAPELPLKERQRAAREMGL